MTKNINLLSQSPVYVGDRAALKTDVSVITYDATSAEIKHMSNIDELSQCHDDSKISWINISGLKDIDGIKKIGMMYNIHPLSIEDILNTEQQPKVEIFDNYRFISIKTIQHEKIFHHNPEIKKKKKQMPDIDEFLIDQVSMIIMENVIITFQEIPGDSFDGVRKRILDGTGEIRKTGTDYLAYSIIDAVVDEYFLTLDHLEEDIEKYEERTTKTNDAGFVEEIQETRKYLLQIRRAVSPLKEIMQTITRHENFFHTDDLKPFLQDLNENLNNAIVTIEHYREWLSNIININLSFLSQQMNRVMKVLAIISTIFIPLTFIAGVYGMNFEFMPELNYAAAYPIVLGGMGLIALIMIVVFKIRRWF